MIAFRGYTKRYGPVLAVDSLSLDVSGGEVVALLGPNGSGKTTALKGAAGLVRPTAGAVLVGDPPRSATCPAARRAISFLPQRVELPAALSAAEVVAFYCALRGVRQERAAEVLRFASLNGASARTVGTFSGGMVQRLGLAVAMIPEGAALLLDEPAASLDATVVQVFYEALHARRREGRAVLFSTHRLGDIEELADRFAILIQGRLAAVLTARELRDRLRGHGLMRVTVGPRAFPDAALSGEDLIVPAAAGDRAALLDALRERQIPIVALATTERSLEDFYRELVSRTNGGTRDASCD